HRHRISTWLPSATKGTSGCRGRYSVCSGSQLISPMASIICRMRFLPTPDWLLLTSWNMRKTGPPPERTSANSLFKPYCNRRLDFLFYRNPFCEQYLTQPFIHIPASYTVIRVGRN